MHVKQLTTINQSKCCVGKLIESVNKGKK